MKENQINNQFVFERNPTWFNQSNNLEKAKKNIESIVFGLPIATILINENKNVVLWNQAAEKLFGWKADEVIGEYLPIIPARKQTEFHNIFQLVFDGGSYIDHEITRQKKDGSYVDVCFSTAPHYDSNGVICGYLAMYIDVTERKKKEQEIKDIKFALDQSSIVAITDANGRITYVNDMFCDIYQYSREEILGQDYSLISLGCNEEFFQGLWTSIKSRKIWRDEIKDKAHNGSIYWMDTTIIPFFNEDGKPHQYITIKKDITKRKLIEEILQIMAYYDNLTGLPNRAMLYPFLEKALARCKRKNQEIAIMFIDLDRFKFINNTLGHDLGDELLIQVSERLVKSVREGDIVARQGGDEFIILIEDTETSEVSRISENGS